ncbi:methylated-DNA--[protein]-cysteine S-methyltransferase [Marinicella marina]|uniref:methylated-DNA--[protein]-cysteine S-methyltransferase n=1 Tax=Marinicella marina TaxID=2996016 RepID=UPI0024BC3B96|nr:methylated-DNA--[protein]-cysteine S-methyltransferase [Marinicella marina]MDJ1140470.1 methylated-DNA--[protein]-cysteine S-methyltransferase [Marinicella marina]
MIYTEYLSTAIGTIEISATEHGLSSVYFIDTQEHKPQSNQMTASCKQQLQQYFLGQRQTFDLPLLPDCGTDFQTQVWKALHTIPYGEVASYADIAERINNPKAVRAVGAANGKNPISIIVPCHRVIGANGTLTGYAGGLRRKEWLLNHESQNS